MPIYLDGLNYFDALQASLDRVREDLLLFREPESTKWWAMLCQHHRDQMLAGQWVFIALDDDGMDTLVPIMKREARNEKFRSNQRS